MFFVIIIMAFCVFRIVLALRMLINPEQYIEKKKGDARLKDNQYIQNLNYEQVTSLASKKLFIFVMVLLFSSILFVAIINDRIHGSEYTTKSSNSVSESTNKNDDDYCTICGGKLVCAICGEKGLYCENASYGSGTDHYCNKHWGDVVEWHEKKKHK